MDEPGGMFKLDKQRKIFFQQEKMLKKNQDLKDNVDKLNFTEIDQIYDAIKRSFNDKKDNLTFLNDLVKKLKEKLFNLKGKIIQATPGITFEQDILAEITNQIYHKLGLKIRNNENEYTINFNKINKNFFNLLYNKTPKGSRMCFTNLKAFLYNDKETKSMKLCFKPTINTKIYRETPKATDSNNKAQEFYRLDLTENNEYDFCECIDESLVNELVKKLPDKCLNFNDILTLKVVPDTFTYKNNFFYLLKKNIVTLCGIITKVSSDSNNILEILSFKDANVIKVKIYNDPTSITELKPREIVMFQKYILSIDKNYDFVLKDSNVSNLIIIGLIPAKIYDQIVKNIIYTRELECTSIISLTTSCILTRIVQKYCVILKDIIKIKAESTTDGKIKQFPWLKIKGKFLIDDGTFEAFAFISDLSLISMFDLPDSRLEKIAKEVKNSSDELTIYDKYSINNYFDRDILKSAYTRQFFIYGIPFANLAKYNHIKGDYRGYLEGVRDEEENPETAKDNTGFINGIVVMEKNLNCADKPYLVKKPCLKVIRLEVIENI